MDLKAQYEQGRRDALERCLEAVWDASLPNGQGAWSEGQYDACEEVAKLIMNLQKESEPKP